MLRLPRLYLFVFFFFFPLFLPFHSSAAKPSKKNIFNVPISPEVTGVLNKAGERCRDDEAEGDFEECVAGEFASLWVDSHAELIKQEARRYIDHCQAEYQANFLEDVYKFPRIERCLEEKVSSLKNEITAEGMSYAISPTIYQYISWNIFYALQGEYLASLSPQEYRELEISNLLLAFIDMWPSDSDGVFRSEEGTFHDSRLLKMKTFFSGFFLFLCMSLCLCVGLCSQHSATHFYAKLSFGVLMSWLLISVCVFLTHNVMNAFWASTWLVISVIVFRLMGRIGINVS